MVCTCFLVNVEWGIAISMRMERTPAMVSCRHMCCTTSGSHLGAHPSATCACLCCGATPTGVYRSGSLTSTEIGDPGTSTVALVLHSNAVYAHLSIVFIAPLVTLLYTDIINQSSSCFSVPACIDLKKRLIMYCEVPKTRDCTNPYYGSIKMSSHSSRRERLSQSRT